MYGITDEQLALRFSASFGTDYWGMWVNSANIDTEYVLEPTDETHKNIKLAAAGNYTLVYNSSSRIFTTITRNGDAE